MGTRNALRSIGMAALLACWAGGAGAAGFALTEQGTGTGNAYAGAAATAEDASTIFFNPAGLTQLPGRQVVVGVSGIKPSIDFSNGISSPGAGKPLGTDNGDAGQWGAVPDFYLSWALTDRLWAGIGVNSPFGLKTAYDSNWIGRYQAINSTVTSVNVNPTLAFKINDVVSVGAGASYQKLDATLTQAVNLGLAGEGSTRVNGDDWGWGWNVGALFDLAPDMRVGVAYRSKVSHRVEGDVQFFAPPGVPLAGPIRNGPILADVTLPESASLSVFQKYNEFWDIMGDLTWTHWSRFQNLNIVRSDDLTLLQSTPEHWKNTYRFSLGLNYHVNERWKLRGGFAYDQTPVPDQYRTARIPDQDRTWLAIGTQWKPIPALALDFGYAHVFVKNASINDNQLPRNGLLNGSYSLNADVLSLQLTYSF